MKGGTILREFLNNHCEIFRATANGETTIPHRAHVDATDVIAAVGTGYTSGEIFFVFGGTSFLT